MKKSTMSIIFGLFFVGSLITELYCLLEFRSNPVAIIGPGVIALISGFFCFDGIVSVFESQQEERQKLLKEQFEIQNMLEQEQFEHIKQMTHLIEVQQELMEQLTDEVLDELTNLVGESAKLQIRHHAKNIKKLAEGQQVQLSELLEAVRTEKTSGAVSDGELKKLERTITAGTEKISVSVDRGIKALKSQLSQLSVVPASNGEKELPEEEAGFEEIALSDIEEIPEEIAEPEAEMPAEPELTAEPEIEAAEPVLTPPSDDPNHVMTPEEIAALIAGASAEPELTAEPEIEAAEPEPVAEPVLTPPSDDPNHVMTPEEIAALIAGASVEPELTAESEIEAAEPEPVAEPVLTPPSDDPNHVMTPEEIAAMIASMG